DSPPRLYGEGGRGVVAEQKNCGDYAFIPPPKGEGGSPGEARGAGWGLFKSQRPPPARLPRPPPPPPGGGIRAPPILILRRPAARAFGDQVEEVPDGAEIVAGREAGVGHTEHLAAALAEHRHAGMVAVRSAVAHVGRERALAVRNHAEAPAARGLE